MNAAALGELRREALRGLLGIFLDVYPKYIIDAQRPYFELFVFMHIEPRQVCEPVRRCCRKIC